MPMPLRYAATTPRRRWFAAMPIIFARRRRYERAMQRR